MPAAEDDHEPTEQPRWSVAARLLAAAVLVVALGVVAGVHELTISVPGGAPARVRVAAGAGSVAVYEDRRDGVAAGELIGSPDWARSADRLYVDLVAGANAVTVDEG